MNSGTSRSPEVERLERLVTTLRESGSTESPEMRDLNRTLDRLITAEESLRSGRGVVGPSKGAGSRTDSGAALRVAPLGREEAVTGMQAAEPVRNRFYDLESNNGEEEPTGTAMEAIVPETQTLVNGATIRLELATELVIRGQRVGKGSALYGTVRLSNERLLVTVSSIRCGSEVFPVAMRVLDQDGLPGIYSPGSITRDATRESAGEAVGELGPAGLETTTSGQALNAGIQLARNLARRKVQLARVTVKAGYRVFLQDESKGH
jgi:conjugative transposon TraM protein